MITTTQAQQQRSKKPKTKETEESESVHIDLKDLLIKVGEKITSRAPIQDEEQMFLNSLLPNLKTAHPFYRKKLKIDILNCFFEIYQLATT